MGGFELNKKGFMLVEALLVFALCVLIVVSIAKGSIDISKLRKQIDVLNTQSQDEKLKDAYGS